MTPLLLTLVTRLVWGVLALAPVAVVARGEDTSVVVILLIAQIGFGVVSWRIGALTQLTRVREAFLRERRLR